MKKMAVAFLAVSSISACGGGGGGATAFQQLSSEGQALIAQYGAAPVTAPASMPTTGTATYHGTAAYSTQSSDPAYIAQYATSVSELDLTVDFAGGGISGSLSNFNYYDPSVTVSGQLAVNGAVTGNTFSAGVSGTLTESGAGLTIPVNYSGTATGEFVGTSAEALRGVGTATASAGIFGSQTVYALYGAVRQ